MNIRLNVYVRRGNWIGFFIAFYRFRLLFFNKILFPTVSPSHLQFCTKKISCCWISWVIKVHIFWEGHKILRNLPLTFDYSTHTVKSKRKISQNFVAVSEYMNFKGVMTSVRVEGTSSENWDACVGGTKIISWSLKSRTPYQYQNERWTTPLFKFGLSFLISDCFLQWRLRFSPAVNLWHVQCHAEEIVATSPRGSRFRRKYSQQEKSHSDGFDCYCYFRIVMVAYPGGSGT